MPTRRFSSVTPSPKPATAARFAPLPPPGTGRHAPALADAAHRGRVIKFGVKEHRIRLVVPPAAPVIAATDEDAVRNPLDEPADRVWWPAVRIRRVAGKGAVNGAADVHPHVRRRPHGEPVTVHADARRHGQLAPDAGVGRGDGIVTARGAFPDPLKGLDREPRRPDERRDPDVPVTAHPAGARDVRVAEMRDRVRAAVARWWTEAGRCPAKGAPGRAAGRVRAGNCPVRPRR